MSSQHTPVLLSPVVEYLKPADGETYIDATFGAGGYTRAILSAADCKVWAWDRDPSASVTADKFVQEFSERFSFQSAPFGNLLDVATDNSGDNPNYFTCGDNSVAQKFDGVVFDLGVSSMQIDQAERGFSFQSDGPLDMRMFAAATHAAIEDGMTAADVVNTYRAERLADIFYHFGDERRARAIAKAIVADRAKEKFSRTRQLAELVTRIVGNRPVEKKHPATRVFQALRIYVNDELGQLTRGLTGAERLLRPGGRLLVVTFHSIEDRIVKKFIKTRSGKMNGQSRHLPQNTAVRAPSFQIVNQRGLPSSEEEINANVRARSARLRVALRTENPAWPIESEPVGNAAIDGG